VAALRPDRLLASLALAAACAGAGVGAYAQEREELPIQLNASTTDFDYQKGVLKFESITITQGEVRITAERAEATGLDFNDSTWELKGAVRIQMPEASLASDTARVRFAGGEVASAAVTGAPATFQQRSDKELAQGRANRIDYDLQRGTVELDGEAWLSDGKTEMTGGKLVYSTANQRVVSRDPVTITIQPGKPAPERPGPEP
jgi:lipopolysaccharide transport protein LptA